MSWHELQMNIVLVSSSDSILGCNVRVLSSVLEKHGHSVRLFFVTGKVNRRLGEQVAEAAAETSPDFTGISVMTDVYADAAVLTDALRKKLDTAIL